MGMVAASIMLPNGNSSSPKRQEQGGGQQRNVAAPAGAAVPLPNNLAKDNRNSLTKVCICMHASLSLFLSLS